MRFEMLFATLLAGLSTAFAADPTRSRAGTSESSAAGQPVEAVKAAMAASLEAQRASISTQLGRSPSSSFFMLPPPAPTATAITPLFSAPDCDPLPRSTLDPLIDGAAAQQELQPELLRSLIQQESGFRPCAVSPKGAIGLTQLMPATAAILGVTDPFDPKENINAGARFLKRLLIMYHDLPTALGAYNAGPSRVSENGGIPNIPETIKYVKRILAGLPASY